MACARGSRVAGTAPTRGAFGRGTTWQRQPKGAAAAVLVHVGFLLALAAAQPDTLNSVGSKNSSAAVQHNHTEVVTDAGELLAALQRFVQLSREEARRNTNSNKTVRSPPSPPPPPNLATQRGEVTHDDHQRMFHIRSLSCTFTIFVRGLIRVNATAWNRTASSSLVVVRAGTLCIQGDVQDSDSQIAVIDTGGLADATPLFMDPARLVLLDVIIVNPCRMATKLGVSDAVYTSPSDVAFISKSPQQTTTFVNVTVYMSAQDVAVQLYAATIERMPFARVRPYQATLGVRQGTNITWTERYGFLASYVTSSLVAWDILFRVSDRPTDSVLALLSASGGGIQQPTPLCSSSNVPLPGAFDTGSLMSNVWVADSDASLAAGLRTAEIFLQGARAPLIMPYMVHVAGRAFLTGQPVVHVERGELVLFGPYNDDMNEWVQLAPFNLSRRSDFFLVNTANNAALLLYKMVFYGLPYRQLAQGGQAVANSALPPINTTLPFFAVATYAGGQPHPSIQSLFMDSCNLHLPMQDYIFILTLALHQIRYKALAEQPGSCVGSEFSSPATSAFKVKVPQAALAAGAPTCPAFQLLLSTVRAFTIDAVGENWEYIRVSFIEAWGLRAAQVLYHPEGDDRDGGLTLGWVNVKELLGGEAGLPTLTPACAQPAGGALAGEGYGSGGGDGDSGIDTAAEKATLALAVTQTVTGLALLALAVLLWRRRHWRPLPSPPSSVSSGSDGKGLDDGAGGTASPTSVKHRLPALRLWLGGGGGGTATSSSTGTATPPDAVVVTVSDSVATLKQGALPAVREADEEAARSSRHGGGSGATPPSSATATSARGSRDSGGGTARSNQRQHAGGALQAHPSGGDGGQPSLLSVMAMPSLRGVRQSPASRVDVQRALQEAGHAAEDEKEDAAHHHHHHVTAAATPDPGSVQSAATPQGAGASGLGSGLTLAAADAVASAAVASGRARSAGGSAAASVGLAGGAAGGGGGAEAERLATAMRSTASTLEERKRRHVAAMQAAVQQRSLQISQDGGGQSGKLERTNVVTIDSVLGRGSWGTVYSGTWRGLPVAIKTQIFLDAPPEARQGSVASQSRTVMEAAVAISVKHRNVVQTYAWDMQRLEVLPGQMQAGLQVDTHLLGPSAGTPQQASSSGADEESNGTVPFKLFLFQELCGTNLAKVLEAGALHPGGEADLPVVLRLLLDMACGLEYLHRHNILHGDLKPANVLVTRDDTTASGVVAKLADFGLVNVLTPGATHVSNVSSGTPFYIAPEVCELHRASAASDIYALGVITWQVVSCQTPYMGDKRSGFRGNPCFGLFPPSTPHAVQALSHWCLTREPKGRPTATQVVAILSTLTQAYAMGALPPPPPTPTYPLAPLNAHPPATPAAATQQQQQQQQPAAVAAFSPPAALGQQHQQAPPAPAARATASM